MNVQEFLRAAAILIISILIIGACFVWFRYWQVEQFATLSLQVPYTEMESERFFAGAPAAVCSFAGADFTGSTSGTMYILDGRVRWDGDGISGARETMVHRILEQNGTVYLWYDDSNTGIIKSPSTLEETGLAIASHSCRPWWNPNMDVFDLPSDVVFELGAGG